MAIQAITQARQGFRRLFRPLGISASGMTAQSRRMDAIAQNIANVDTVSTPDGGPYRRKIVQLQASQELLSPTAADPAGLGSGTGFQDLMRPDGVRVLGVFEDPSPPELRYEPGHPNADLDGYVVSPNVTMEEELTDLMDARRAFEANATVFQVAKAVLRRALDI